MEQMWKYLQAILVTVSGALGYFVGEMNGLLTALVIFVCVDYATGVVCGFVNKNLSSYKGTRGIFKKLCIFVLVGVANILDQNVIGTGSLLRSAIIMFHLANEGISILENTAKMGLNTSPKLKKVLEQIRDKLDTENETE